MSEVGAWRSFRKKPIVVRARPAAPEGEVVPTLEGRMVASPGDWIVEGVKGETYPVKPDIFAETYEAVDE